MQITDDSIKAAVATVILEKLPEEKRTELLENAIKSIIEPMEVKEGFGYRATTRKTTKLQEVFNEVAWMVTRDVVREELSKPEYQDKIKKLFADSVSAVFDDEDQREKVISRIAGQFAGCIKPSYED